MLSLFKRSKIEDWEILLLKNTIKQLPEEFHIFIEQINAQVFSGVLTGMSDLPGYVAFSYNSKVISLFEKKEEKNYKITGIKVYDSRSKSNLKYSIYISSGVINGYSIEGADKYSLDLVKIDVSRFKLVLISNNDFKEISQLLDSLEVKLLNPADIYTVLLNDKVYYHLIDLEDGDFIGMDTGKMFYKITHDPFEIIQIHKSLNQILETF
ncbi:hypothetical protein [Dyadobacter diqingensis]|uniref:hypothetical protein n=1 Tax=Dyadobacter diqingensis TaxID=2938121 RepID=UPI0020C23638|nr:hypothetical protein [Dyadobacter diqingensis]